MTDQEIIKKVIDKAEKNGFDIKKPYYIYLDAVGVLIGEVILPNVVSHHTLTDIIFSHYFAKKFWGHESCNNFRDIMNNYDNELFFTMSNTPIFIYHLQQMVREKEPLKYLEKFL